jgi:hypothetical protein
MPGWLRSVAAAFKRQLGARVAWPQDLTNVLEYEELNDAILVGHSAAGVRRMTAQERIG